MNIDELLQLPESEDLDWKERLPRHLIGKSGGREEAKASLLKDVIALANSEGQECAYLVYGVKDRITHREVLGIEETLDDADLQTWLENTFDPPPKVALYYLEHQSSKLLVIAVTRSPKYPHVVKTTVGSKLIEGQVWFRRGSKNTVALRDDLARMIKGDEPFRIEKTASPLYQQLRESVQAEGRVLVGKRHDQRDEALESDYLLVYWPGTRREVHVGEDLLAMSRAPNESGG